MTNNKIIDDATKLLEKWKFGSLEIGSMGYKFQYYKFINIAYLYLHGVDAKNPDLMDERNPHHFIPDFIAQVNKINEQTRIDFREIGFIVDGHSELAKYIAKSANRKTLTINNDWTEIQERVTDDANWYGSGYKMIHSDAKGVQKHTHLDPWDIIWDLYDFQSSAKMKVINKTLGEILDNKRYKKGAKSALKDAHDNERDKRIQLMQYVDDDNVYILELANEIILMESKRPKDLFFVKYSHEYRRGFPDAAGRGICEKILSVIVQNKVARARYNEVEAIATKLLFAKVIDGENDKVQNKTVQNLKNGMVIPMSSPDHIPQPISTGGQIQLNELLGKIGETQQLYDNMLSTPEVLQGDAKTLGANSSGRAIQSLTENASSVHKDVKKRYARVAEKEYRDYVMPYILKVFNSEDNIRKFLDPMEWNIVKKKIIDYELSIKQAELLGQGVDPSEVNSLLVDEETKLRRDINSKSIVSKDILEALRDDVKNIQPVISGEKVSRQARAEFLAELKANILANPEIIDSPLYVGILKKEAKNLGLSELEITELINDIKQ